MTNQSRNAEYLTIATYQDRRELVPASLGIQIERLTNPKLRVEALITSIILIKENMLRTFSFQELHCGQYA
jgi:hypothetical protein